VNWIRRVLVALLGVVLIVDSVANQFRVFEVVLGAIMIGLVPIDWVIDLAFGSRSDEGQVDRLREVMREKPPPEPPES